MSNIYESNLTIEVYIGKMIKNLRKQKKMRGIDLGIKLGVSQQQVSRYENGKNQISITVLLNILAVFHISPEEFFLEIHNLIILEYFFITYLIHIF